MKYIILLCFGLLYSFGLSAQNTEFIEPGEVSVRRAGDSVYVSLRLRVTDIGSDNLVTLTPVLYKGTGGVRSLPPCCTAVAVPSFACGKRRRTSPLCRSVIIRGIRFFTGIPFVTSIG